MVNMDLTPVDGGQDQPKFYRIGKPHWRPVPTVCGCLHQACFSGCTAMLDFQGEQRYNLAWALLFNPRPWIFFFAVCLFPFLPQFLFFLTSFFSSYKWCVCVCVHTHVCMCLCVCASVPLTFFFWSTLQRVREFSHVSCCFCFSIFFTWFFSPVFYPFFIFFFLLPLHIDLPLTFSFNMYISHIII